MDEADAGEVAAMITGSISKNLTSKTWLRGVSELLEAVNDPDRYGERYVQNFAGTVVPTGVAQVARTKDPVLRQTETVLERIKSCIPGYSEQLPPRLNVWGDPIMLSGGVGPDIISPIYTSREEPNKLSQEIVRLKLPLGMPSKEVGGVRLKPEQYNAYVAAAGHPAKQILSEFVNSPEYDQLPDGAKRKAIMQTIMRLRETARQQVKATIPPDELVRAARERRGIE